MENVEMIEKLMEKADVTYEEAKGVLESVNWNLLDALIALEKEGKIKTQQTSAYSTKQDITEDIENIRNTEEPETFRDVMKNVFTWIKKVASRGMDNRFCVHRKDGSELIGLPVTVLAVILIIAMFSGAIFAVIVSLVVLFFCGCTFSFDGPDLGTEKINSNMAKIKYTGRKREKSEVDIDDRK